VASALFHYLFIARNCNGDSSDCGVAIRSYLRRSVKKARWLHVLSLALLGCLAASGQTGAMPAAVTIGMPAPVAGTAFAIYALVTNPALSPAPTGTITFDFGDGTPTVTVPMDYRVASTTHSYASVGPAKVTATYSGDSTFASASAVLQGAILTTVSKPKLTVYGDSISYATNNASATGPNWTNLVAYVQGWTLDDKALPSYTTADECPFMYGAIVTPSSYSAVLLGQNDFSSTNIKYIPQYEHGLEACVAWLLIPGTSVGGAHPKVIAQDPLVSRSGSWATSTLYSTMGLQTVGTGDSLTTTIAGSSVYLGLSGTIASNYTVDVYVDGNLAGEYTPAIVHGGYVTPIVPWGIRIAVPGSALTDSHTVTAVCRNPGASGCFVDWIGGNGFVAPNKLPLVWLGEPYHSNQPGWTYEGALAFIQVLRQVGNGFQADGLGLTFADVFDNFDGPSDSQCLADLVHPSFCGQKILAATFLGAMDWLFTKDQRIDIEPVNAVAFSTTPVPIAATATSGLLTTLSAISGPATIAGNEITATGTGTVTVQADQAGNADFLPAASAVTTFQVTPAPVTVSVTPSATQVIVPGTVSLAVQVGWSGSSAVPGSVTLSDGTTAIGTAPLDATGAMNFANLPLSLGSHVLTVSYPQQGNFAAGSSAPVSIDAVYPPPDFQVTASSTSGSVASGQDVSLSLKLMPSLGFNPTVTFTCVGLPALATCSLSQAPLTLGVNGSTETITIATAGKHGNLPPIVAGKGNMLLTLAAVCWSPGLMTWLFGILRIGSAKDRRKYGRIPELLLGLLFIASLFEIGCGGQVAPSTPTGASVVTIRAVAVQGAAAVTREVKFNLTVTN
jgi:hypothetical protein